MATGIILSGRKSSFRAGLRPDSHRENFKIGPPAGRRPAGGPMLMLNPARKTGWASPPPQTTNSATPAGTRKGTGEQPHMGGRSSDLALSRYIRCTDLRSCLTRPHITRSSNEDLTRQSLEMVQNTNGSEHKFQAKLRNYNPERRLLGCRRHRQTANCKRTKPLATQKPELSSLG